jgi:hypothetical protein
LLVLSSRPILPTCQRSPSGRRRVAVVRLERAAVGITPSQGCARRAVRGAEGRCSLGGVAPTLLHPLPFHLSLEAFRYLA